MFESLDAKIAAAFTKVQQVEQNFSDCTPNMLLMLIAMELDDLRQRTASRPFQINPLTIPTGQAGLVIDTDPRGFSRRVILWLDPITSAAIPSARVHTSRSLNANAGGQGFPVQIGQFNDLGVVDGDSQLWGIASTVSPVVPVTGSVVSYSP